MKNLISLILIMFLVSCNTGGNKFVGNWENLEYMHFVSIEKADIGYIVKCHFKNYTPLFTYSADYINGRLIISGQTKGQIVFSSDLDSILVCTDDFPINMFFKKTNSTFSQWVDSQWVDFYKSPDLAPAMDSAAAAQ